MIRSLAFSLVLPACLLAQGIPPPSGLGPGTPPQAPKSAQASAPADFTGYFVSVVTEDWRWRMVTPIKGDFASIPLNNEGRRVGNAWDPDKDAAAGEQCKSYGAPAVMRVPGRVHISWADENTLKLETDAGTQTRLLHFAGKPAATAKPSWQGYSVANWERPLRGSGFPGFGLGATREGAHGKALEVVTTQLRAGYLRKNGPPYSENTLLKEYYDLHQERNGDTWFTVTTVVQDPTYLNEPFVTSTDFKKIPDGAGWSPQRLLGKMKLEIPPMIRRLLTQGAALAMLMVAPASIHAQFPAPPPQPPRPAKTIAPEDVTGNWVSIVTEDWRWRMVTPAKGDYTSVPLNPAGRKAADGWDPDKDIAAGNQCKAYGAAAIMRVPGRVHITWTDDNTLKVEADAGTQTRTFHFNAKAPASEAPSWQGYSEASWDGLRPPPRGRAAATPPPPGGSLKVVTTHMKPGYLRKNGVPYSGDAELTEYYDRTNEPNGDSWLIVTTIVHDPANLNQDFVTSTHFKMEKDGSKFSPSACEAK